VRACLSAVDFNVARWKYSEWCYNGNINFGIKHRLTTTYHPQAIGLDERFNQTLSNTIVKFAREERCSWDEKLPEIVYSYNTAVQEPSRHTPFEAMFGRQAKLPVDFNTEKEFDPDVKLEKELNSHSPSKDVISTNHKRIVKRNVEKAQKKQNEHYDKKHGAGSCYSVGLLVYKKDFLCKKRRGGKLDSKWMGPYKITADLGKGLFKLQTVEGGKVSY